MPDLDALPPPIERLRAAFAEVGYDPTLVLEPDERKAALGAKFLTPLVWPIDVRWRARESALIDEPCCFACFTARRHRLTFLRLHVEPCDATARFVQDCGRTRETQP